MPTEQVKKGSIPEDKTCGNCCAVEGSPGAPKLSACARCGLVLYCSRDCQRTHWKANHKHHCVAKDKRVVKQQHKSLDAQVDSASSAVGVDDKCSICLENLSGTSVCTLPCTHVFHGACVAGLRKFGVKDVCPLSRKALPPGPKKLVDEAIRRYMMIGQFFY